MKIVRVAVACLLLLDVTGCRQLSADEQRALEEYRRSQRCCNGGGS
jgi:hypothetical protein